MLLGCFCWSLPDPKYHYWLKDRLWVFYVASGVNFLLATVGGATAAYYYYVGPALYSLVSAAALIYILLASGPLLATILVSFAYT